MTAPLVRIGDVVRRVESIDPRAHPDHTFAYIDISSVNNRSKRIATTRPVMGKEAPSRARLQVRTDDVLVATTRPYLNAVAMVPRAFDGDICSTGFAVLRADELLDPRYLFLFVQSPMFIRPLSALVQGALYPAVSDRDVLSQRLPLPERVEQSRIAAELTEQFGAINRARTIVGQRLALANDLAKVELRSAFQKAAGQGPEVRLGDIAEVAAQQVDPRLPQFASMPLVNGENIESGTCRITFHRTASEEGVISPKYLFRPGDVLYSKLRPYLRKAVVAESVGLCSADMYPITVDKALVDSGYLCWLLVSHLFTAYAVAESARARMPKLNREQLFRFSLHLPPLDAQRRLVAKLTRRLSAVESVKRSTAEQLGAIDDLQTAILRKAFGDVDP